MKNAKIKTLILSFFILLFIAGNIIFFITYNQMNLNKENARYLMTSETSKLQYAIDSKLLSTKILEMIVTNQNGQVTNFQQTAKILYAEDSAIRSLQLAPNGVVTYVYPLEGNENIFMDLFYESDLKAGAKRARDSRQITLFGPQQLLQGGIGMVVRNPIFLKNEHNEDYFWGFSTVVLNVPEIFDLANLELLTEQRYYYRIWKFDPSSGNKLTISQNTDTPLKGAIQSEITVLNDCWYLSLVPKDGWIPVRWFLSECTIALIIVILSTLTLAGFLTVLQQKKELQHQANTDSLTGIKNGRFFLTKIKALGNGQTPFILLYLDMNNFKQINDQFGHDIGDTVLREVASRIRECIRDTDIASRIGGDEFTVIIMRDDSNDFCEDIKARLKERISKPLPIDNQEFCPEISIGYARFPGDSADVEHVIRLADRRMYAEKQKFKYHSSPNID